MNRLEKHPFKEAVKQLLRQHFSDEIVDNFSFVFEAELYGKNTKSTRAQLKDDKLVLQVMYVNPDGLNEYVCDLYSWWDRKTVEYKLLTSIRQRYQDGLIFKHFEKGGEVN